MHSAKPKQCLNLRPGTHEDVGCVLHTGRFICTNHNSHRLRGGCQTVCAIFLFVVRCSVCRQTTPFALRAYVLCTQKSIHVHLAEIREFAGSTVLAFRPESRFSNLTRIHSRTCHKRQLDWTDKIGLCQPLRRLQKASNSVLVIKPKMTVSITSGRSSG